MTLWDLINIFSLFRYSINELVSHAKPFNVFINKFEFSNSKSVLNYIDDIVGSYKNFKNKN